jgi:AcrR family transcriptional regulator
LRAAQVLFAQNGYDSTTIRAIAAEAGVDSAMVIHFFSSKERLFAAVLDDLSAVLPALGSTAASGNPADRGRLLARSYFEIWESPTTMFAARALLRGAVGSPKATAIMRDFLNTQLIAPDSAPEIAVVAGMLLGVAVARYVVQAGPVARMTIDEVVQMLAPSLQVQLESL